MRMIEARSTLSVAVRPFTVGVGGLFAVDRVCLNLVHDCVVVDDTMSDKANEEDHEAHKEDNDAHEEGHAY